MKRLLTCCAALLACILSAPALARADVQNPPATLAQLDLNEDSTPLPLSLDTWGVDSEAYPMIPTTLLAQQRMAVKPPFIDWDKFELGGFVGVVAYSSDFEADPDIAGGFTGRVPVPGLPGNWGFWSSLAAAGMTRDIAFFYPHKSGVWFSANVGVDYTLTSSEIWLVRAQVGGTYNFWNNIQALDNNFAGTVGLDVGFYWIKFNHRTTVNLNPQISFNGSNWYAIIGLEFQVQF